jgi:hypothetical protein
VKCALAPRCSMQSRPIIGRTGKERHVDLRLLHYESTKLVDIVYFDFERDLRMQFSGQANSWHGLLKRVRSHSCLWISACAAAAVSPQSSTRRLAKDPFHFLASARRPVVQNFLALALPGNSFSGILRPASHNLL